MFKGCSPCNLTTLIQLVKALSVYEKHSWHTSAIKHGDNKSKPLPGQYILFFFMVGLINTFLLLYCSFNSLVSPYFAYILDSFLYHFYPSKAIARQPEARFLSFLILARDLERFQQYAN